MDMSVEDVFREYKNRHAAMEKALTTDVEHFYQQCDPGKENLCLYGFQNGEWQVDLPADEVPPELPEPALGINFARDGMHRKDWLSLVAVHSDAWLYAVAFYHGARFNKAERRKLFDMINELPTLFEIVSKSVKEKKKEEKHRSSNHNNSRKGSAHNVHNSSNKGTKRAVVKREEDEEYDDEEDEEDGNEDGEHDDTYCGSCGDPYTESQFWIACDICEKWYHGSCVRMTERKAQQFDIYKCPSCNNKKARI